MIYPQKVSKMKQHWRKSLTTPMINNGHGIKAIKDEIKNSEDRLLQKLNSIHNSKQKDAEESNHALNHENTVERDNEGQWTKIQSQKKPNEVKTLIIGDSMIKYIDPKLISADGSIIKKSRPGGKLEDMSSMLNNCELKCKKYVIIHMGTNNITSNDSPTDMASKLATETEKRRPIVDASASCNRLWYNTSERCQSKPENYRG
jgi:hypothetical protein